MTDDNNKDGNPDFEDDVFDEASFDENYYEDDAVYDEADLPDDAEFEDVDFEETDWNEDEDVGPVAGKKEKSLYRGEKKSFLSFNTIVILGAFVLGAGVLAFTVMGQSSKVSSSMVPKFISSLNIGDVMDGRLFGGGGTEDAAITGEGPSSEDTAATQDTGFLDNPDGIELQATATDLPPQPSPISPTEIAPDTALTPMPEIIDEEAAVQDDGMIPRGPDEIAAVTEEPADAGDGAADVPAETAQPSAEDILKRALAKRDQPKEEVQTEEKVAAVEEAADEIPVAPVAIPEPVAAPVPTPVAEIAAKPEPVKETVVEKPTPAPSPVVAEVNAASDEAIKSLESKIDTMLKRMEQIETELSTVREGRDDEYESLEETVSSLKGDIVALKKAPAPKPQAAPKEEKPVAKEETKKSAPSVKREEPAYSPPKPAPAAAPTPVVKQASTWELRAAQPGKAWVSKTGQRDMQGVVVGETLQGIGRITAISYQNGRWVVMGTQGQIRQ